jgi:predicted transcriptional regulator
LDDDESSREMSMNNPTNPGLYMAIFDTLKKRGPLPVDYLAYIHGRRTEEIREYLSKMEEAKIVKVEEREGKTIALTSNPD